MINEIETKLKDIIERLSTSIIVTVADEPVTPVTLTLEQSIGEHHQFNVTFNHTSIKKIVSTLFKKELKDNSESFFEDTSNYLQLIGKTLGIYITQGNDNNSYQFEGIICDIIQEREEGKHGLITIKGMSPTILLERGKRLDIFSNKNLKTIFQDIVSDIKQNLSFANEPIYNEEIDFLMQYQESDWEFLKRLSAITGETLFYTGCDLVFGKYKDFPKLKAIYDEEISKLEFGIKLIPNHFSRFQYLLKEDKFLNGGDASSTDKNSETESKATEGLLPQRPPCTQLSIPVESEASLNDFIKREKNSNNAQTIYVKGTAKTCIARIGRILSIEGLGTYRIIATKHMADESGKYTNEFEAIPEDVTFLPRPDIKMPIADSMLAKVIRNDDPDGFGRVIVEFPFAIDKTNNSWLRVMSPDAGSSGEVPKNRGMIFIPEVGDQVMVGFEFGDPNRPYVMGSMFHGKNSSGGGGNNATKSIFTRSGTQIVFNDGQKSIHISDPSGNTWDMDGNGTISVNAPSCFKVNSGASSLTMNASGEITISASTSVEIKVGEATTLSMKTSSIDVTSSQNTVTGTNTITGGDTTINQGNVTIEGKVVTIKGTPVNIN